MRQGASAPRHIFCGIVSHAALAIAPAQGGQRRRSPWRRRSTRTARPVAPVVEQSSSRSSDVRNPERTPSQAVGAQRQHRADHGDRRDCPTPAAWLRSKVTWRVRGIRRNARSAKCRTGVDAGGAHRLTKDIDTRARLAPAARLSAIQPRPSRGDGDRLLEREQIAIEEFSRSNKPTKVHDECEDAHLTT